MDEIINEINEIGVNNNQEVMDTQLPCPTCSLKKKKPKINIIQKLKSSLEVGEYFIENHTNIKLMDNLEVAKPAIISLSNKLNFYEKKTVKTAFQTGECLMKIQELCQVKKKKFKDFLKKCSIKWEMNYIYFLISLYRFSLEYPKICEVSLSVNFIKNNFKKIKAAIWSSNEERAFWKAL